MKKKLASPDDFLSIAEYCLAVRYGEMSIETANLIKEVAIGICNKRGINPHFVAGQGVMRSRSKTLKVKKQIWDEAVIQFKGGIEAT